MDVFFSLCCLDCLVLVVLDFLDCYEGLFFLVVFILLFLVWLSMVRWFGFPFFEGFSMCFVFLWFFQGFLLCCFHVVFFSLVFSCFLRVCLGSSMDLF